MVIQSDLDVPHPKEQSGIAIPCIASSFCVNEGTPSLLHSPEPQLQRGPLGMWQRFSPPRVYEEDSLYLHCDSSAEMMAVMTSSHIFYSLIWKLKLPWCTAKFGVRTLNEGPPKPRLQSSHLFPFSARVQFPFLEGHQEDSHQALSVLPSGDASKGPPHNTFSDYRWFCRHIGQEAQVPRGKHSQSSPAA